MLFSGRSTKPLNTHYGFDTELMSAIENDQSADLSGVRQTLVKQADVEEKWVQQSDLEIVRWACQCVGTRAALLSGVAVAAVIKQTESKGAISVGIDGRYAFYFTPRLSEINVAQTVHSRSLFEFYPNFEQRLRRSLRILVGQEAEEQVKIGRAKDGSGVGGKSRCTVCCSPVDRCTIRSGSLRITGNKANDHYQQILIACGWFRFSLVCSCIILATFTNEDQMKRCI